MSLRHGLEGVWHKSSYSNADGDCVEIAIADGVAVGDTKEPNGTALRFTSEAWAVFVSAIKSDQLG